MNHDFNSHTPKVLKECLDLFLSPKHDNYPAPIESGLKYSDHPDIQYFKTVKLKNHYDYHKFKKTPKKTHKPATQRHSNFDPFSRGQLLSRLTTYSPLNWSIPMETHHELTELKCAQNGWKCIAISVNDYSKNHLMCISCMKVVTLRFNELQMLSPRSQNFESSMNGANDIHGINDINNVNELNLYLCQQYIDDITTNGHDTNCPWRHFETPLDGIYYLKPFIDSTKDALVNCYLGDLKDLIENNTIIVNKAEYFQALLDSKYNTERLLIFIKASNELLLEKFYGDNKENKSSLLELIPPWFYLIALLGWDLKVQSFANHLVLFLTCSCCNKKLFLDRASHPQVPKDVSHLPSSTGLSLPTSKILTPMKIPPSHLSHSSEFVDQFHEEELDDEPEGFDLLLEHKPWCMHRKPINDDNEILIDYLFEVIINSYSGNDQEAINKSSSAISTTGKRLSEFDIKEGLERLTKLRKLYLADD